MIELSNLMFQPGNRLIGWRQNNQRNCFYETPIQ